MTHKTKADKIASTLRAKRNKLSAIYSGQSTGSDQSLSQIAPTMVSRTSPAIQTSRHDVEVYEPNDIYKTVCITTLIGALLTLVYVFQYKGYF